MAGSATLVVGCAGHTRLQPPVRAALASRFEGRTVELRHSCYFGDLYDDNDLYMLSPYPFGETTHIVDPSGVPIHPQRQRGIVPAGTRFVIERMSFPDGWTMAKRMLTTPRYYPWVYLRVQAPEDARTDSLPEDRAYILVLPLNLDTEAAVVQAMDHRLADEGHVRTWLSGLRPTVQVAIRHKEPIAGMRRDELIASAGDPLRILRGDAVQNTTHPVDEIAWYPAYEAWLVGDAVSDIVPARVLQERRMPPEPQAQEPTTTDNAPHGA